MEVSLGSSQGTFSRHDYRIDLAGRTFLTGQSGTGKSTLMRVAAIQAIQAGEGLGFIDFHGDTADDLTGYIPRSRFDNGDVIYLNPLADRVFSLNTLTWSSPFEKEVKIQAVLSSLKAIYKDAWGPETERIVKAGLDAITEYFDHPNLLQLYLFIARKKFRRKVLRGCKNPLLKDFADQYDNDDPKEGLRPSERMSKFSPSLNKTDSFTRPILSAMLGQSTPLDWKAMIDSRKIIICNLNKGRLGKEVASLIGSLILSEMWNAALRRNTEDDNPDFYCFVDEAQNCFAAIDIDSVLSESRKFRFFPFFGLQYLSQITNLKAAFGNYSNWITYRLGGEDAQILQDEFAVQGLAENIVKLPNFTFVARKLQDNIPYVSHAITARKKIKKLGDEPPRGAVQGESLNKWGTPRKDVLEKINKFLAA
jgi:energy-coupling factor transporter ATP-binding protein EcfA2